jgi:predicted kinase
MYLLDAKGTGRRTISAGVECAVRATKIVNDGIRKGMQVERVRGAIGDGG